ncbi:MAG TPA: acetyl-CoA carboxylase biotin carboxyl carrier protein [Terriglobales bacterium]|jgi:acetyl-CoA carboxylase biotin carboxyl carrier protein|nr:acetyl-CoA carboxylase biotin carboxyl carrier protein [Terriglobales bacterium]
MNQKELKELIEFLIEKDIAEFELERGDVKVRVKRASEQAMVAPPPMTFVHQAPASPPAAEPQGAPAGQPAGKTAAQADEGLHIVKSPIVGTYYEAPSPGAPPFVKVGDTVDDGQILCIIEAMKLMNEIESDVAGEIVKKLATNGQPVEYGQPLFAIRQK